MRKKKIKLNNFSFYFIYQLFVGNLNFDRILRLNFQMGILNSGPQIINQKNHLEKSVVKNFRILSKNTAFIQSDKCYTCIKISPLSTHIREWTAVNSIQSSNLMPLAPYIMKAAPVVSVNKLKYFTRKN